MLLVEKDAFRDLMEGSFEEKRKLAVSMVGEALKIVKSTAQFKMLATFEDKAIGVEQKTGDVYEFLFAENKCVAMKKIEGPKIYHKEDVSEFYDKKISEAVNTLASGKVDSDFLAAMMLKIDEMDTATSISRQLQSTTEGYNLWNKHYSKHEARLVRENWEQQPLIESRNWPPDDFGTVITRVADMRRRVNRLLNRGSSDLLSSIDVSLKNMAYWTEKLLNEKFDHKRSDILKSLVECHIKIDHIVTSIEQGRVVT